MTCAVPLATAVTSPVAETPATPPLSEDHATVARFMVSRRWSSTTATRVCVAPSSVKLRTEGLTRTVEATGTNGSVPLQPANATIATVVATHT